MGRDWRKVPLGSSKKYPKDGTWVAHDNNAGWVLLETEFDELRNQYWYRPVFYPQIMPVLSGKRQTPPSYVCPQWFMDHADAMRFVETYLAMKDGTDG